MATTCDPVCDSSGEGELEGSSGEGELEGLVARSPHLHSQPVPVPVFREGVAGWERFKKFSMKRDDPYKSKEKPAVPEFLRTAPVGTGPIVKRILTIEGLETDKDLYVNEKDKSFAWNFDGTFTEQQCRELIEMMNAKKFIPALTNNGWMYEDGDPRKGDELEYDPARRDTFIAMFDCPELATWLWESLGQELKSAPCPVGWHIDHINSYVRGLCYCKADQCHPEHFDQMMSYPKGKYGPEHCWSKARSILTLFVYLSGVPPESGGATAFPVPYEKLDVSDRSSLRCHPMPGRVLIFSQNLWHIGEPLKDHIKYVIRMDVMALPIDEEF